MQTKALKDGKQILNNVTWMQSKNSNTFKIERNPETHQMTGKEVVIPPIELKLDASKYKYVLRHPINHSLKERGTVDLGMFL